MNRKMIMTCLVILIGLGVFVSAIQKEMNFPGTTTTEEFVKQNMQFGKGWNLVQGILNPEWIETNSDNIKVIYAFNPTTNEYVRFYPEPENNKIGETNFAWSTWGKFGSLWVYSEKDFNSNYWKFKDGSLDQTPLFFGWNFMAFTSEMSGQTFNQIKGDCNIEDIYLWNYIGQEWSNEVSPKRQISNLDKPIDDDFEGYGFIIKVSSDCILGTSGSSTIPPGLPEGNGIPECADSDGGKNYNVKGIISPVNGPWGIEYDSCANKYGSEVDPVNSCTGENCVLVELYCSATQNSDLEYYNCPNGCNDGICIQ